MEVPTAAAMTARMTWRRRRASVAIADGELRIADLLVIVDCRFDAFRGERDLAKTHAGRVEDRIADCRGGERDGRLSGAHRFAVWTIDEDRFDDWSFEPEREAVIGAPVDRGDLLLVPRDFFAERAAHALQGAAFDLILHPVRRRDRTAVLRRDQSLDENSAGRAVDLDLGDERAVAVVAFVQTARDAASARDARLTRGGARRRTRLPVGRFRRGGDDFLQSRVADVTEAIRDRIGFHPR